MSRPVAVVTGAGSGIGFAIAARLAHRHDLIVTHANDDHDLRDLCRQVDATGANVTPVTGDLTNPATLDLLGREVDDAADRLEILVSNAGAYPRLPWPTLDLDQFRHQVELNLITHAACAKLVTPALMSSNHGRIVAISSVLTQLGRTDLAAYIAAKSGLEGLVRALARELGPAGVTVNCVRAGSIEVPAEHSVVADHDAMVTRQLDRQSIKRRGRPDDVAAAVEFFISREAAFITGQCLTVDGGWCPT